MGIPYNGCIKSTLGRYKVKVEYYPTDLAVDAGSCLQGHQEASYEQLVKLFGEPNSYGDGEKVHIEWVLNFDVHDEDDEDSESYTATIYDWKEDDDVARYVPSYNWHIGGFSKEAAHLVSDLIIDDRFGNNSSFYGKFRRVRS